jgi:hypothetical protein
MKVVFTGSRTFSAQDDIALLWSVMKALPASVRILVGDCRGLDRIVRDYAGELGLAYQIFPADWEKYGKAAGPIRNNTMLDYKPDLVIGFRKSASKGTTQCVGEAKDRGIPTLLFDL